MLRCLFHLLLISRHDLSADTTRGWCGFLLDARHHESSLFLDDWRCCCCWRCPRSPRMAHNGIAGRRSLAIALNIRWWQWWRCSSSTCRLAICRCGRLLCLGGCKLLLLLLLAQQLEPSLFLIHDHSTHILLCRAGGSSCCCCDSIVRIRTSHCCGLHHVGSNIGWGWWWCLVRRLRRNRLRLRRCN